MEKNLTDEAIEIDDLNIKLIIKALPELCSLVGRTLNWLL